MKIAQLRPMKLGFVPKWNLGLYPHERMWNPSQNVTMAFRQLCGEFTTNWAILPAWNLHTRCCTGSKSAFILSSSSYHIYITILPPLTVLFEVDSLSLSLMCELVELGKELPHEQCVESAANTHSALTTYPLLPKNAHFVRRYDGLYNTHIHVRPWNSTLGGLK